MKTYASEPGGIVVIWGFVLLLIAVIDYRDIGTFLESLAIIVIFLLMLFVMQRKTYLTIANGDLRYRHYSFERKAVPISDIVAIRTGGAFGGLGVALYVIYKHADRLASLKIYSKNFSRGTIDEFVKDIVRLNPAIQVKVKS